MAVCVLGSINLDVVQTVERLPRPGETVLSSASATFLGGKGANQAVASARMGVATRFLGAVGDDDAGGPLLRRLQAESVDVSGVVRKPGRATGAAYICVSADGENMIVVAGGANGALEPEDIAEPPGAAVYLAQLETPAETVAAFLASAKARSGLSLLNAAPASVAAAPLIGLADILVVNETELACFAGQDEVPSPDACAALAGRLAGPGQTVVVTLGAAGAVAVTPSGTIHVAGRAAEVVDTTGAGDCFCGVLAARLSLGHRLEAALQAANAAAALSVGRPGAAASMPSAHELDSALAGA